MHIAFAMHNRFCANFEVSVRNVFSRKEFPNVEKMTEVFGFDFAADSISREMGTLCYIL